jgi:hypothetical protein
METMIYVEPPDIPEGMTLREWRLLSHAESERNRVRLGRRLLSWFGAASPSGAR